MALNDSNFAAVLKGVFDTMDAAAISAPKDNQWLADQLAKAFDDQMKTADVNPGIDVDGGTQTGGSLTGAKTSSKGSIS